MSEAAIRYVPVTHEEPSVAPIGFRALLRDHPMLRNAAIGSVLAVAIANLTLVIVASQF